MNLQTAKQVQVNMLTDPRLPLTRNQKEALKLGIDAFNRVQAYRLSHLHIETMLLHGETK